MLVLRLGTTLVMILGVVLIAATVGLNVKSAFDCEVPPSR
jgi:hypothetical protein